MVGLKGFASSLPETKSAFAPEKDGWKMNFLFGKPGYVSFREGNWTSFCFWSKNC